MHNGKRLWATRPQLLPPSVSRAVYLVTISRVLSEYPGDVGFRDLEQVSRQDVARFVIDSMDRPEGPSNGSGRPRQDRQTNR